MVKAKNELLAGHRNRLCMATIEQVHPTLDKALEGDKFSILYQYGRLWKARCLIRASFKVFLQCTGLSTWSQMFLTARVRLRHIDTTPVEMKTLLLCQNLTIHGDWLGQWCEVCKQFFTKERAEGRGVHF